MATTRPASSSTSPSSGQHSGRRALVAALVALVVLVGGIWWGSRAAGDWVSGFGTTQCRAKAGAYTGSLDAEAMNNAALIAGVALQRALPARAVTIALATAMQESKLHNITHGDRDSLGLFQQRPSQGWGSRDEVLDPIHATNAFYDALVKVPSWQVGEITKVAQAVQRSGFPEAYAQHEPEARAVASNLTGETAAGLGCRLAPLSGSDHRATAAAIASDLTQEMGVPPSAEQAGTDTLTVRAASDKAAASIGAWAVAKAAEHGISKVTVGAMSWTRDAGTDGWSWHTATSPAADQRTVVIR